MAVHTNLLGGFMSTAEYMRQQELMKMHERAYQQAYAQQPHADLHRDPGAADRVDYNEVLLLL